MSDPRLIDDLLARLLGPRLGYVPPGWPRSLHDLVERLARARGLTPATWLGELVTSSEPEELPALLDTATVGHTSFFRHPEQFEELRRVLVERARRHPRPQRVWCAGCSSGEEAYSVALLAEQVDVSVEVLGTDVNPRAIAVARAGQYTGNRLARLPGGLGQWTAPPRIRSRVRFEVASLIDERPSVGLGPFDIIFCRNVLIYFERELVPELLDSLAQHLLPDGLLVVSPADAVLPLPPSLARAGAPGWIRLTGEGPDSGREPVSRRMRNSFTGTGGLLVSSASAVRTVPTVEEAARLLGSGQGDEAEQVLAELLNCEPDNMAAWFLLGEALLQRGERAQARAAFARAGRCTVSRSGEVDGEALRAAALRRAEDLLGPQGGQ